MPASKCAAVRLPLVDPEGIRQTWQRLGKISGNDALEMTRARVDIRHAAEFHGVDLDEPESDNLRMNGR